MLILLGALTSAVAADLTTTDAVAVADSVEPVASASTNATELTVSRLVEGEAEKLDYAEAYASFDANRAKLRAVLAEPGWHDGPRLTTTRHKRSLALVEAIVNSDLAFGDPSSDPVLNTTVRSRDFSSSRSTQSRYKLDRDEAGRIRAVAFGMQYVHSSRGISITSVDVLVMFDEAGRATEAFVARTGAYNASFAEEHFVMRRDGSGRVDRVEQVRVAATQQWTDKGQRWIGDASTRTLTNP